MPTAYHLKFKTSVHIGIEAIGQEKIESTIRSDTLWGAVISKWLLLYDDDPDELCSNSPFKVSSCFPLIGGTRFFPVPVGALDELMNKAASKEAGFEPSVKTIKKIRYLAEPLFKKLIKGEGLSLANLAPDIVYPYEAPETYKSVVFAKEMQRPRVRTDQLSGGVGKNSFFYCSDQFFAEDSGIFFLAEFSDSDSKNKFEASLALLGDSGIGADRSVGRGFFSFSSHEVDFGAGFVQRAMLLSLCIPSKEDAKNGLLTDLKTSYTLIRRFGAAGINGVNRFRRPDTWMFGEGSLFPDILEGSIRKVIAASEEMKIPHNVYRYGKAFCISVGI